MKLLAAAALALSVLLPAQAQDGAPERARIKAARDAAQGRFDAQEKACRATFAVTDCVDDARRARNAALAELRRQELALNEAERTRRAAERRRELDERQSAQRAEKAQQEQQRRAEAAAARERRQAEVAEKARRRAGAETPPERVAPRAAVAVAPQGKPRDPQRVTRTLEADPQVLAARRRAHEQRVREAREHKQEVLERNARRNKPPAASLPTPP